MEKRHRRSAQVIVDVRTTERNLHIYILNRYIPQIPRLLTRTATQTDKDGISRIDRMHVRHLHVFNLRPVD